MTIINVDSAGVSARKIVANNGKLQIAITGTWAGASVDLQKMAGDGTYQTIHTFTDDDCVTVDVVRESTYQFNTTGTPTLKCDVAVESGQII